MSEVIIRLTEPCTDTLRKTQHHLSSILATKKLFQTHGSETFLYSRVTKKAIKNREAQTHEAGYGETGQAVGLCSFANLSDDPETYPTCCMSGIAELDKSIFHKLGDILQGKRPLLLKNTSVRKAKERLDICFPFWRLYHDT